MTEKSTNSNTNCLARHLTRARVMKMFATASLGFAALTTVPFAYADEDAERERLARIGYELERLQGQVNEAGREANSATRVKFRYDMLARDLEMVRQGIDDHLDSPRQPRPAPPLKGDYRR